MGKLSLELLSTTQQMANAVSVDMQIWDRHSNACIQAAKRLSDVEAIIDSLQRENDRYVTALEKIMGNPMDADAWFRREARRALAGGNNGR